MLLRALLLPCFAVMVLAQDPQALFDQAVAAQQHGDYAHAVDLYRQLVKISPKVPAGWINLGAALLNLQRNDEAIQALQEAEALDPSDQRVHLALAFGYYQKGDFAACAREAEPLVTAYPSNVRVALVLADADLHLEKPKDALAILTPFVQSQPKTGDFAFVYAQALIANGRATEGADILEAYARPRDSADAYILAGDALLKANLSDRALQDFQMAAKLAPAAPGLATRLGQALERNGKFADAADAYRKATTENPNDFPAWIGLAATSYSLRDLSAARAAVNRALMLDKNSIDARYTSALISKSEGNFEQAASDLEVVVRTRPNFIPAHAELAALYFRLHRTEEGQKQRQVVDQLSDEQRKAGP